MQVRACATKQAGALVGQLAFTIDPAVKGAGPDSMHDLRVAMHCFGRCLRVFAPFFPERESKKIRRHLRQIMRLAAEVRDRDIVLDLCEKAGLGSEAAVVARLRQQREQTQQELATKLARLRKLDFSRRWRTRLMR